MKRVTNPEKSERTLPPTDEIVLDENSLRFLLSGERVFLGTYYGRHLWIRTEFRDDLEQRVLAIENRLHALEHPKKIPSWCPDCRRHTCQCEKET